MNEREIVKQQLNAFPDLKTVSLTFRTIYEATIPVEISVFHAGNYSSVRFGRKRALLVE